MLPQYKMVLTSCILSSVFLLGLIIYRYLFKRKVNLFYLLILISIIPIVSVFRVGTYESGDLTLHAQRLISFYNSLINYHLIPRWTPEFISGYGDPHFLFAYFLPYFIGSILHFVGFSLLTSLKILIASSFILSGITMFAWVKNELGDKAGFVSAIFYLFTPYHLVDMHFRVTIAENLSFVFLPLILLAINKIVKTVNRKWFFILCLSLALLVLSHQAISVMFLPIMLFYAIFVWLRKGRRNKKKLAYCFLSIAFGFLISAFYWLPIVFLAKFTQQGSNPSAIIFPHFTELLFSPWRYGFLFQGHMGELSYLIGYTQLFIVFLCMYLLIKGRLSNQLKSLSLFFLILFFLIVFMILPISSFIWKITPLLKYSQYSTRLLVILTLCISIIGGIVAKKINKNSFIIALCLLTIFYTILNWGNRGTIPQVNDEYLKREFSIKADVTPLEPTAPMWADLDKSRLEIKPKDSIEILNGAAAIEEKARTPILHEYIINAKSDVELKENTLYFPGWTIVANDRSVPINYKNLTSPGIITFKLNKGIYNLAVKFSDVPIIIFSKWVSLLSFVLLIIFLSIPRSYIPQRFK